MRASVPFQYAYDVQEGRIVTGKRIKQAVARFFRWIDEADSKGFYLDHEAGLHILWFFPTYLNHTEGSIMAGKPVELAPFQAFTQYNIFAWKKMAGSEPNRKEDRRRITKVYDRRGKKNSKSTEMAGLATYMMSYDEEPQAKVYVGATKEEQARICWGMAESFVNSPWANPRLRQLGFITRQRTILFPRTESVMMPLGGDSKTQDGINAQLAIIDEYHAHVDDGVKENLESSMVMRKQPLLYQITTAGTNVQSACKRYEDSITEVLEGRAEIDNLWIMIHEMDEGDDWENPENWVKANPLLGYGMDISMLINNYNEAKISPSKIPQFKTKNLNMWVDAPTIWIESEIWKANAYAKKDTDKVLAKFQKHGGHMGVDLSSSIDITSVSLVSEPDEDGERYKVQFLFCPKDNIDHRSKEDRVPYRFWADQGHIIATPGNQIDYGIIEDKILEVYWQYNIKSLGADQWQFVQMGQNLMAQGINVSYVGQSIATLSAGTREFERLVRKGALKHDGNPVVAWMLAGCQIIADANDNKKVHKGKSNSNGRRIDDIPATINALTNSLSLVAESNESAYNQYFADNPDEEFVC